MFQSVDGPFGISLSLCFPGNKSGVWPVGRSVVTKRKNKNAVVTYQMENQRANELQLAVKNHGKWKKPLANDT